MNTDSHAEDVARQREAIGTKPREPKEKETVYHRGGEGVKVRLVGGGRENWYVGMFVMAVQTWGGPWDSGVTKWNNASVSDRMKVIKAILQRQALPLALEHPQFLFEITGCSRSAFDQIARARIGVTFSSMGTRDNAHGDFEVVVPPHVYDDEKMMNDFTAGIEESKSSYIDLLKAGRSWQDARASLPQSMVHRFCMNANYAALSGFMGKRLQFCEQYDTVAVAWKMRQALAEKYAVLAIPLRPSCDFAKKCTYHQANLNELFSCLFKGCGRWPDPFPMADFDESSTEPGDIVQWLGGGGDPLISDPGIPINWVQAFAHDRHWFEEKI
jgi:thymidylate synthase ThyX